MACPRGLSADISQAVKRNILILPRSAFERIREKKRKAIQTKNKRKGKERKKKEKRTRSRLEEEDKGGEEAEAEEEEEEEEEIVSTDQRSRELDSPKRLQKCFFFSSFGKECAHEQDNG